MYGSERGVPRRWGTIYERLKQTAKHTLIFGLGSLVSSALGFFLVPVYARYLSAAQFGVLSLLTITLTLVTIVLKFGLNHAFFRHYYETEDAARRRRIVGTTFLYLLFSSLLMIGLLYVAAPHVSAIIFSGDFERADLLRLVVFISFFEVMALVPDSILRARFQSARYSIISVTAFALQLFLIWYLVIFVDASVETVLIGRLAGAVFETAVMFLAVRRELSVSFSASELRALLSFGIPLIFGQIGGTLFMMIDRFFLVRYSGNAEVGYYSMANALVMIVAVLVTGPFSQVWTVMRFSVMKEEGAEDYYSSMLTYIVLISMFLSLCVAAVAGDGLLLYATRGYYPAATLIPLLAIAAVLDGASRVLNVGITLRKKTIFGPLLIMAALLVNIALNFLLIPRWGSLGATVSTLISYVVFCSLRYWASNLFFRVRYEWRRVFTILGIGVVLVAAFYMTDYLRGDLRAYRFDDPVRRTRLFWSVLVKGTLALSFPLLLYVLRFYNDRERRRIGDLWNRLTVPGRRQSLEKRGSAG